MLHGHRLQPVGVADQEIALLLDGREVEPELARRDLHPHADVGHAAGNKGRHRRMGELALLVTVHSGRVDAGFGQHQVQQEARARAGLAVDEAHVGPGEVGDAENLLRIARPGDQPLAPGGEPDDALALRVEPATVVRHGG
ncbi:hypothetical protein RZS08_25640, partial [Arthrospira platensis SPKY1]|nr:hypothetical protein [Arthrospira platensis SPKY1]